jgi:AraC-like DNA-binding protein
VAVTNFSCELFRHIHEICYWLLTGPGANQVSQIMIMANGHDQRIIQAIRTLRDKLSQAIHVGDLALAANMSPATFHRQFKSVTGMTPLQYQKQLRLHEARRLLIFSNAMVESAALDVGYASVSQFSREYRRACSEPRLAAVSLLGDALGQWREIQGKCVDEMRRHDTYCSNISCTPVTLAANRLGTDRNVP